MSSSVEEILDTSKAQTLQSGESAGGKKGNCAKALSPSTTSIDLRRRGDVKLVHRAVVNGWDTPQEIKDQICQQFDEVLPSLTDDGTSSLSNGQVRHLLGLVRLMLVMDARNRVEVDGYPKSVFPQLRRRRYPEGRRAPSAERILAQREELLRLLSKLRPNESR